MTLFARLRAAWRALTQTTALVAAPDPVPAGMRISPAALWEANRNNHPTFIPETTFRRAEPLPGTLPEGMAMDLMPEMGDVTASLYQQMMTEGLGFLGYPYLAELSQRAEYRKIAAIWAEHCTRKWIKLRGDDERVKLIEQELDRLCVRALFLAAIEKECFFGRVQLFLDFGDFDKPRELATPLLIRPEKVNKKRPLKRLTILEPMWSYPGIYDAQNPLAPNFYAPTNWYVQGRTIHASRLLTLVGHEMPNMLKPAYAFGGVALTQLCKPYVDNWLGTRQSVSDLIRSFSTMVLGTDMGQVLQGGPATQLFARVDLFNKTRDNRGTFVIDKNSEEFTNVSAPIAGLHELQAQSQEQMSSVSGIPLVILLGITPSGLNASSEGEIRVFYDAILAYLEKVCGGPLRQILDIVQLSLFGEIDQELSFEFLPLWEMSDKDKADVRKSDAEADGAYVNMGAVDPEEVRERLRNDETSLYHGVDLSGPAPEPPEQDDDEGAALPRIAANDGTAILSGMGSDDWREGDHPREEDGKFGSGGGHPAIGAFLKTKTGETVSKSAVVKALAKQGVEIKSNDPALTAALEKHNGEAPQPRVLTREELREQKKAEHEARLTPEQREKRDRLRAEEARRSVETANERRASEAKAISNIREALGGEQGARFTSAERAAIERAAHTSAEHANAEATTAMLRVITETAVERGWTLRHTSEENGRATSRYLVSPAGTEVRLSDHRVPETAQRESQRGVTGDPKWRDQLVLSPERGTWMHKSAEGFVDELDELAHAGDDVD